MQWQGCEASEVAASCAPAAVTISTDRPIPLTSRLARSVTTLSATSDSSP